ncbi:RNA 2',3'-cyclic phosphodiesterase [Patescibacteria group bacterium]|nr:RNA 2',3'-cyclic phosphodiesterase [Patescibacteria group bacterium]
MRLFIGLPIPTALQNQLERAWEGSPNHPAGKMMKPTLWHVTLAFLDEVPEERLSDLIEIVRRSLESPPAGDFSITGFETFPKRKPSRIVARVEPEDYKAWEKYALGLRDMLSLVAPNVDRKPWMPHISITRSLKGTTFPNWEITTGPLKWTPSEVAVIKSVPGPEGSSYTHQHVFPLHI